ncbi:MAG: hypothetical protein Q8R18_01910 [bacterium]|nr:hypothetical protein [bacterium]
MMSYQTITKRWGNSLGLVIPKNIVEGSHIRENEKVTVLIIKDSQKVLEEIFGIAHGKIKTSSQKIKDRSRAELYD